MIPILAIGLSATFSCALGEEFQEGKSKPSVAVRVTFVVDGTTLRPLQVQHLTRRAPPSVPLDEPVDPRRCVLQLEDASGHVLYRQILPHVPAGETEAFPAAPGAPAIRRVSAPGRGKPFVVKIPELPNAKDLIIIGFSPEPGSGGLPGTPFPPIRIPTVHVYDRNPTIPRDLDVLFPKVTKVVYHGEGCWTLVILSEGFQSSEMQEFADETWKFVQQLWGTPPFNDMWDAINVYRIDMSSEDSGADDPMACGGTGATASTAFDATFCTAGIRSLMDMDTNKVIALADWRVPDWDMALVMVNSNVYGGGEWPEAGVGLFSLGQSPDGTPAWQTGVHEIGHAFNLGDEYGASGSWPFGEPLEPNITKNSDPATVKWASYITVSPVPTVLCTSSAASSPFPPATIGMFEGGANFKCGLFHSEWICKMRHHGYPFCAVCRDAIRAALATFLP
ncbi:MAG: M64 family metallopeptidase [Planctomycetota bacterium]